MKKKNLLKIVVLCIFVYDVLFIFVLDDFEISNLEFFNMYYYKGGSKKS